MIDTNSVHIAGALADHGVDVYAKHSVGDNADRLTRMLSDVLERADGVITTGGLGPTVDDLTKDAVARASTIRCNCTSPRSTHSKNASRNSTAR